MIHIGCHLLIIHAVFPLERQRDDQFCLGDLVHRGVRHDLLDDGAEGLQVLLIAHIHVLVGRERDVHSVSPAVHHLQGQWRAGAQDLAFVHHHHGVAQHVGLVQVVSRQQYGSADSMLVDQPPDPPSSRRIHTGAGLI